MNPWAALGPLILLMGVVSGLELTIPFRPDPVSITPATVVEDPVSRPAQTNVDPDWTPNLVSRPLFTPTRRPSPPSLPPTATVTQPPLQRLTGTMIGPFGKIALFAGGNQQKTILVAESDAVGLWTVDAIMDGAVILTGPGGQREVHVEGDGQGTAFVDMAASVAPAEAWANPCSRLHRRAGQSPAASRDERCTLEAAMPAR